MDPVKNKSPAECEPLASQEKPGNVSKTPGSPSSESDAGGAGVPKVAEPVKSSTQVSDPTQSENKESCKETEETEKKDAAEPEEIYAVETLMNTDFEGKLRIYRPEPNYFVEESGTNQYSANMISPTLGIMGNPHFYRDQPFPENRPFSTEYQRYNRHWGYPENEQVDINYWRCMHQYYSRYDLLNTSYDEAYARQYYEQHYFQQRFPHQASGDRFGYGYQQRYDRHGQAYNSARYQPYSCGHSPSGGRYRGSRPVGSAYSVCSEYNHSCSGRSEHSSQSPSKKRYSDEASHSGYDSPDKKHGRRRRERSSGHGQRKDEGEERLPVSATVIQDMRDCLSDLKKKIEKGRRRASSRSSYRWNCRVKEFIEENLQNALSVNKSLGKKK